MSEFSITHNMKVGTVSKNFNEVYGATLRIYDASNHIADENEPLSKYATKGIPAAEKFNAGPHLLVGNFEKRLKTDYGLVVQVADKTNKKLVDDSLRLVDLKNL